MKSYFGSNEVLKIVNFFVEMAKNTPKFLTIILEANIVGLLRHFLELELRNTASPIAQHDGEMLVVYDKQDLGVLHLIAKHGLLKLLPITKDVPKSVAVQRKILSHAFNVVLRERYMVRA